MIAGVVLAAGFSRRMGRHKLLLDLGGQPVIRLAVAGVAAAGVDELVVVVPPEHADLAAALVGIRHRLGSRRRRRGRPNARPFPRRPNAFRSSSTTWPRFVFRSDSPKRSGQRPRASG